MNRELFHSANLHYERPRCREITARPDFVALKEELSVIMRKEVLKSREIELSKGT